MLMQALIAIVALLFIAVLLLLLIVSLLQGISAKIDWQNKRAYDQGRVNKERAAPGS